MNRLFLILTLLTLAAIKVVAQSSSHSMTNSRDCTSCHEDPHQGTLGTDCASCHDENTFRPAVKFDHNRTRFALTGSHANLKCSMCHVTEIRNGEPFTEFVGLKFQLCTDCHRDEHNGQFTVNNTVKDCRDCHTVDGFGLTTYTIAMHSKTGFPLTGSHLAVSCKECHYKNNTWEFTAIGTSCIDCHNNVHGDQITAQFMPGESCTVCHSTINWNNVAFNHDKTNFKLFGKHTSVSCRACHYNKDSMGVEVSIFHSLNPDCKTCHKDIHFGQFAVATSDGKFTDCTGCHTPDSWNPTRFDHDSTAFPLTGAHMHVPCLQCHKRVTAGDNSFVLYRLESSACVSCHS